MMAHPTGTQDAQIPSTLRWLLALLVVAHLAVLWSTTWLPLGQLGSFVQALDLAARYHDAETGYRSWFLLPHLLDPGTLPLWLARVLRFANAWTLAKLLLSVYIAGLPLALLRVARAHDRSPWLALLAMPLTWNALVNAGQLDALWPLPLLLWTVAVTRQVAARGGGGRTTLLAAQLVLLYFSELVYFGVAAVSAVFLIIWYRRDIWSLARLWVLLPSAPLVLFLAYRRLLAPPAPGSARAVAGLNVETAFLPLRALLARVWDWTLLFLPDHADLALGALLAGLWLLLLALGIYDASQANHGMLDPRSFERRMFGRRKWTWQRVRSLIADGSLWRGTWDRRRPRWLNIQRRLNDYGLEALTLLWLALYLLLPTTLHGAPVCAELLPVPILLLLALWPRAHVEDWRAWLFLPVVAAALVYSWHLHEAFQRFESEEVADLPAQLADLPRAPRLGYVVWDAHSATAYKAPHRHLGSAIAAVLRGGLATDNPATRAGSGVSYRRGVRNVQIQPDFWADPALLELDYVLLRSAAEPERAHDSPHLEHVWHGHRWWLYRVVHGERAKVQVVSAGGEGGQAGYVDCPRGALLQGLGVVGGDAIGQLTAQCQTPQDGRPGTTPPDALPPIGPQARGDSLPLLCPRGHYVVALSGRADHYVRTLQLQCAPRPYPHAQLSLLPTRVAGSSEAREFEVHCPDGTVAVGIQGRFGDVTDRVGLACAEPAVW